MKHPADPTPRSARDVLADRSYKRVASEACAPVGGHLTSVLVVLHCGSETHWLTTYPVSMLSLAMTWQQVEPVMETRTTYRPVAS